MNLISRSCVENSAVGLAIRTSPDSVHVQFNGHTATDIHVGVHLQRECQYYYFLGSFKKENYFTATFTTESKTVRSLVVSESPIVANNTEL